jgi:hypothetical protein
VVITAIVKIINSPRSQSVSGLRGVIAYCCRDAKTNHEGQRLVSGINCVPQVALQEFMNTKHLHNQNSGRMYYHMVQSFPPEENITPEVAHEIALKLAETIPGFEIVVATHRDAHHVHSHFVINSVSFETGKKYHSDPQSIQALWDASDRLCLEYGFSVIQKKNGKEHKMNDREYRAYDRGDSWKMELEMSIDDCMTLARSREHFIQLMGFRGYEVTWTDTRKNITYTTPQGFKCRARKLNGRKYLKEEMEYEFELRSAICRRYEAAAETNSGTGSSGAADRRRDRTQLEGDDLIPGAAGSNPCADSGAVAFAGNGRTNSGIDAGTDLSSEGVPERDRGIHPGISEEHSESSSRRRATDEDSRESHRDTGWESERGVFESHLRAEITNAQVDDPVSADQSDSQLDPVDFGLAAAGMIAHLGNIIDEDYEPDDYYTRQMRRGYQGM